MLTYGFVLNHHEDFLGYGEKIPSLIEYIKNNEKPRILIYGPYGCGKTSLVNYINNHFKFKELHIDNQCVKSNKNFNDILKSTQYSYYVKTCIVFSDYENILNDAIYNNTIKNAIADLPHCIIFTIHHDFYEKFSKIFSEIHEFYCTPVSVSIMTKTLKMLCKKHNLPVTNIKKSLTHLPDIRKTIQNLDLNDEKDIQCNFQAQNISVIINNKSSKNITSLDMFQTVPMIHENYIKHFSNKNLVFLCSLISYADIVQTHCYKSQKWHYSEHVLILLLCNYYSYCKQKQYNPADFQYGKILSKMSNKQTKYNIFKRLKEEFNCQTNDQLYACKVLETKKHKLLENQFL